jgi:adenylate cyclase
MIEKRDKRKLSAVLSADVKGYSRLMGEDESGTVRTLKEYRKIMGKLIQQHRGRVLDSPGDNLLAEFSSVVDAVDGAVEIQKQLKLKNEELPENRRMEFRIGVNLGDVVDDGESIYGDGVNIAARVESLADGGGICISGTAYDQIGQKLTFGYEYRGEQMVKNIEKPVRIYRVLIEPEAAGKVIGEKRFFGGISRRAAIAAIIVLVIVAGGLVSWNIYLQQSKKVEPASVEKMAFPLPDKPSIAVLPFVNMSGDPEQEYLSDGITEEIITGLSKIPKIFIIARNSTFTYKGAPVKVQKVSEELGVQHVLEGSVRKAGNRIRITAQLVDAIIGHHLWAERYDRDLGDIFALQDEITMEILTALQVKLTEGEQARVFSKGTNNLEAYLNRLQAHEYWRGLNKDDNTLARQLAEKAIALDPDYAAAHSTLGWTHAIDARVGWSKSSNQSLVLAEKLAQKALALNDKLYEAHLLLGFIYLMKWQYEKAIAEQEQAIALNPNHADNHAHLGMSLVFACKPEEAIAPLKKAIRLNPIPPSYYFVKLGRAYRLMEQYEAAIAAYKKATTLNPNDLFVYVDLAATYTLAGDEEKASEAAAEVLKRHPKFSINHFVNSIPFKKQSENERLISALRKAGLK